MDAQPGPLRDGRVRHLFLEVRDLDAVLAFYRDRVGLEVRYLLEGRCAFLALDGAGVQLALYAGRGDAPAGRPHWFLSIDVAGLDAAVARLRARGVEVDPVEDVPFGRAASFRDPEGNVLQLHEPAS